MNIKIGILVAPMMIHVHKHCRLNQEPEDGTRVLVMRFWPRGCTKDQYDEWRPQLAPSRELLGWIKSQTQSQDCDPFEIYEHWRDRYIAEMENQSGLIAELRERHEHGEVLTLLCSCHDPNECHRLILRDLIIGIRGSL